jgi:hypothetical protein
VRLGFKRDDVISVYSTQASNWSGGIDALILNLDKKNGDEWLNSSPCCFTPGKKKNNQRF